MCAGASSGEATRLLETRLRSLCRPRRLPQRAHAVHNAEENWLEFIRSILPLLRQPAAARSHVRVADFRFPASLFDRPNLNVDHTGIRLLHRLRDIEA